MKYLTTQEVSIKWNITVRSVQIYCVKGRVLGAYKEGKTWFIPEDAIKPIRKNEKENKNHLLNALRIEKKRHVKGGIYHRLQIDMTYNSNHIEGSKLTHDETRYIFETKLIAIEDKKKSYLLDDLVETVNHFQCIDTVIDFANYEISIPFIKRLHKILKTGTSDCNVSYYAVGDFKKEENQVGDIITTSPNKVNKEMETLISNYNKKSNHSFDEILDFHVKFERIHPFHDGNGRVGRLIIFKECLKNNIVPLIITEDLKLFYYRGLSKWDNEKGWLRDTCLSGQDIVKRNLDYFKIKYNE